jgi:DNA modification methylase
MQTEHRVIIGNSQQMPELADSSVHLMVTSPPYPMIKMWDEIQQDGSENRRVVERAGS